MVPGSWVASCAMTGVASVAAPIKPAKSIALLVIGRSLPMKGQRPPQCDVPNSVSRTREQSHANCSGTWNCACLFPVRTNAHQLLAEIGALQESHEGRRRAVETFGHELLVLDLALAHPLRHVAQEVGVTRSEIADDEA